MNNYQDQYTLADHRRAELMREAEAHRLSLNVEQPGLADRLLTNVGDWMVAEGTRLKNRNAENKLTETQRSALSAEY